MFEISGTPLYSPTLQSRAQTAENPRGEKGQGGKANGGRKGSPCKRPLLDGETYEFFRAEGSGCIRHIWITTPPAEYHMDRNLIVRFYWDGQETPSVEAPLADLFGAVHGRRVHFESRFLTHGWGRGFNCCFPMPYANGARATVTNDSGGDLRMFFYQVDYTEGDAVTDETPRFHAQFRRVLQTRLTEDYVILDGVRGRGRYLGAFIGLRLLAPHWWGEGEIKMYLDGDTDYPTVCGTGCEDYACSGWGIDLFHAPDYGCPYKYDDLISMYRWHALDPVYFHRDIRVTMQQIGGAMAKDFAGPSEEIERMKREGIIALAGYYEPDDAKFVYFERADDICSTAYWYQTLPTVPFPAFPEREVRSRALERREGEKVH